MRLFAPIICYNVYMESNSLKLNSQQILLIKTPATKQEVVKCLVENICAGTDLNKDTVLTAILKREQGISTTLDTGLSIPHARIEGLTSFRAAVAVIPEGLKDDFGLQIKIIFLFLSPGGEQFFPEHLKLLAKLAETFTPAFIEDLCKLNNPQDILAKLPF